MRMAQNYSRGDQSGNPKRDQHNTLIFVKTIFDVERFGIVAIGEPVISPTDNYDHFASRIFHNGAVPSSTDTGRFAVAQEPLGYGQIGLALVSGVTPVKVEVVDESHVFADVTAGDVTKLTSGTTGAAHILWKESGTGEKWAVVRIGNPSSGSMPDGSNDWDLLRWDETTDEEWKVLPANAASAYQVLQKKADGTVGYDWVRYA